MRAISGVSLGLATLTLVTLWIPFRQGQVWTLWAIPLSAMLADAGALYAMHLVSTHTEAKPPQMPVWLALALSAVGLLISLLPVTA